MSATISAARRRAAVAQAELAVACVAYAQARTAVERDAQPGCREGPRRRRPGEFVADEVSVVLREQPYHVRRLLCRSQRLMSALPTVWAAFAAGDLDDEQVRVIDRVTRRVTKPGTLPVLDARAVAAAQTRSPKQLMVWLLRLVIELEPDAFAARHRRVLADRKVSVVQGADGIGYVTGEMSAADAAAVDAALAAAARGLGAADPRTDQQRRADMFADLLLGRVAWHLAGDEADAEGGPAKDGTAQEGLAEEGGWVEVEEVDLETGELLGTHWELVDADGSPVDGPDQPAESPGVGQPPGPAATRLRRPPLRIGIIVPLSSLLGASDRPGELADRSAFVPGEELRQLIVDALDAGENAGGRPTSAHGDEVLFTRLLTDDAGRLFDTTELGRYASTRLAQAVRVRAGTCRFPTCTVPADRCDLDHHEPVPRGATAAANLDPLCRRHHRGKTFAWLASVRDEDGVDWTLPDAVRYRCVDDPLPTGMAA